MCITMADSHCCVAEISTALQRNYPPIEKKERKKSIAFLWY